MDISVGINRCKITDREAIFRHLKQTKLSAYLTIIYMKLLGTLTFIQNNMPRCPNCHDGAGGQPNQEAGESHQECFD